MTRFVQAGATLGPKPFPKHMNGLPSSHPPNFHSVVEAINLPSMAGGTEAFPHLGSHCHHVHCHQLDFLPFTCDACSQVFCLQHRSYDSHNCPKSDHNSRKVVVCPTCSMSIETTGYDEDHEKALLDKHHRSGMCDPTKKKKPTYCPVKRCKEVLTFSNTSICKTCLLMVCLNHRFPADHACKGPASSPEVNHTNGSWMDRFLAALSWRNPKPCSKSRGHSTSSSPPTPYAVKAGDQMQIKRRPCRTTVQDVHKQVSRTLNTN